jgi:hypothetical protein
MPKTHENKEQIFNAFNKIINANKTPIAQYQIINTKDQFFLVGAIYFIYNYLGVFREK